MNLLLLSLLLVPWTWHILPITAHNIELCRCAADFEHFYMDHHNVDLESSTTTTESIQYPYNYNDYYIDTDGYVIVEGIRVLSDRSTACAHDHYQNDDDVDIDDDDDDDEVRRGRYLMMGSDPSAERYDGLQSKYQPRRALMGMTMMYGSAKSMKHVDSITTRYSGGKGGYGKGLNSDNRQRGKGEERNYAPDIPLPSIFVCPISAAAVDTIEPPTMVPIVVTSVTESPSTQIETMTPTMCVACNDNNVCTIDSCSSTSSSNDDDDTTTTMECTHTPVTCGDNEACDTIDGLCKNSDSLRPCIAVIDESDSFYDSMIDAKWASFRNQFPTRPFCLLQPISSSSDYLYFPTQPDFLTDPRVTYAVVNRDNGYVEYEMDWLSLCGYTNIASTGLDFISFFIDESGSMDRTTVAASLLKFMNDLNMVNLTYCLVYDDTEDWITPFDTVLGNVGGGGSCSAAP